MTRSFWLGSMAALPVATCLATLAVPAVSHAQEFQLQRPLAEGPHPRRWVAQNGGVWVPEARRRPLNTITIEPLSLIFARTIDVEFEHAVSPGVSLFVGPSVIIGTPSTTYANESYFGVGVSFGARFFMFGNAPRGFFLSPFAEIAYASASVNGASGSGVAFAVGGLVGYTWLIGDVFDVSIGGGVQYFSEQVTATNGSTTYQVGFNGVLPALRLALGFGF